MLCVPLAHTFSWGKGNFLLLKKILVIWGGETKVVFLSAFLFGGERQRRRKKTNKKEKNTYVIQYSDLFLRIFVNSRILAY